MSQQSTQDLEIAQAEEDYCKARVKRLKLQHIIVLNGDGSFPNSSELNPVGDELNASLVPDAMTTHQTTSSHGDKVGFCSDQQVTNLQLSEYINALGSQTSKTTQLLLGQVHASGMMLRVTTSGQAGLTLSTQADISMITCSTSMPPAPLSPNRTECRWMNQ